MKVKILTIEIIVLIGLVFSGVTYSVYTSSNEIQVTQSIAKFNFQTISTDKIELTIDNIVPGDIEEYEFSVTNTVDKKASDVMIEYQITLKTLNSMPVFYELYYGDQVVMTCDGSAERDEKNLLTCAAPIKKLNVGKVEKHDYKLKVNFPEQYNSYVYADLIDFVDIHIDSWQK